MKLLVVCEYAFIRESLCNLLQDFSDDLKIIATANVSGTARVLSESPQIDLLLYYLTDRERGKQHVTAIHTTHPGIPVLVVADFSCDGHGGEFIDAGAKGCVSTEFTWQAIKSIMQRVVNDETITPHDSHLINESYKILYPETDTSQREPEPEPEQTAKLTPRQLEVLGLIKEGRSNKEIARSLNMAEATVKTHCSAIFRELGVDNRTQAAMAAEQII